MAPKAACIACRTRKVKCVRGPTNRCERCTILGLEDCVYEPIKKRGAGSTLRMGEACKLCRVRKKKCDAKRPCTRCVKANKTSECECEIVDVFSVHLYQPNAILPWNESSSSVSKNLSLERQPVASVVFVSGAAIPAANQPTLGMTQPGLTFVHPFGPNTPHSRCRSLESQLHARNGTKTSYQSPIVLPPFTVLLSRISTGVPPDPYLTLSSLGAGRFQLSDVTQGELDMRFRVTILCRLNKLGLLMTPERQQSTLRGDTSGTVVHPYFIHSTQSLGMYFYEGLVDSPAMVQLQAKHLQRCLECLAEIFGGRDWELIAQAALWATSGSITLSLNASIPVYMQRCSEAVNNAGLRFIPPYGRPPFFSEELRERLSVLSQIIYFENFLILTSYQTWQPTRTARIEKEFRYQLQEVYPVLFKICPLTMRTKAILLVKDTVITLTCRPTDETRIGVWRQSVDRLIDLLDDYSQELLLNLRRFLELGDESGTEIIRSACLNCLAHLAVLCEVLFGLEPTPQTAENTLCDSSLHRLAELAQDMHMEEYTRHDLLLGLSLEKALRVLDTRLVNISFEDGIELRRCRKTITELRLDLEARLPKADPPNLASAVKSLDGRTEGSRSPNLILAEERRPYGI